MSINGTDIGNTEDGKTNRGIAEVVDTEVRPKRGRRRHTAAYKLRVLKEVDRCTKPGEIGALLRREGLFSSNLTKWRKERAAGVLNGLSPKKRGRKAHERNLLEEEMQKLKRENARLECKLKQAEAIIGAQKKLSELLGITLPTEEEILSEKN